MALKSRSGAKVKLNPQNLKPWPKGVSGNPNGRPRKLPKLEDVINDVLGDKEVKQILAAQLKKARKGADRSAEILLDRAYGKTKQIISHLNGESSFDVKAPIINIYANGPELSADEKQVDAKKKK